jgi:hypothetical protein
MYFYPSRIGKLKKNQLHNSTHLATLLLLAFIAFPVTAQPDLDPTRWENDMRAFDAEDRMHSPPENAIVLTGSSSIARWNDQAVAALAPLTVIPRGFGGSVMSDVLHHLDRVALRYKPRAILIYEGDNDTSYNIPKDTILDQLQQIVDRIHAELPDTRIYVMAVKPSILRVAVWEEALAVNEGYRALAASDPLVYYVDSATPFLTADGTVMDDIFVSDNLHLNDMGNLIWGALIRAALMPQEARFESGF